MDVRQYFRKLRDIESTIADAFPVVVSLETSDGGKPGIASEVTRFVAAKLMAEGRAVLAEESVKAEYHAGQRAAKDAFEAAELARRVQVTFVDHPALVQMKERKNSSPSGSGK